MNAPLPANETQRLDALREIGILDTPPERAYDELSELAAYICQTPVALVSLVDDKRQWFKSRVGWTAAETPREVAFCAHAILQPDDLMVVPNASTDERFANNPLVTSPPGIRFYAGAPLVTAEGHALGTLCVIDHQPRELTAEQARALRALSHQIVAQLRLRQQVAQQDQINSELARANEALREVIAHQQRTEQALRESEQWLELAMRVSRQGPWVADLVARQLSGNNRVSGREDGFAPIGLDEFTANIHPDDRPARAAAIDDVLTGRSSQYKAEYRIRDGPDRWTWVYSCGRVIEYDAAGKPARMIGIALDVTERKRTEDALRQSENALREQRNRLRVLLDHLPVMVFGVDADGRYCLWNRECERVLGYPRDEVIGRTRGELYPQWYPDPGYREWVFAQALTQDYRDLETTIATRDGTPRTCSWSNYSTQVRIPGLSVWGSGMDVTERKAAAEGLRMANERLALAIRGSNVGIWENDMADGDYRSGRVHCTNILEQLGHPAPAAALDYRAVVSAVHPDDLVQIGETLRAYLAGEIAEYSAEFRARHRDGSYRWMLSRGVAVRDAAGRPVRFVGTRIDITERKKAEDALRHSEERFRGTFENAGVGIAHADFDGRWLRVNEKLCTILGYPRAELLTKTFADITHPDDLAISLDRVARLRRGEYAGYSLEKRYVRKDGSPVWVDLSVSLQHDAAGTPTYTIAIIQDISRQKRLEGELRQAMEAAEAVSRTKSEFLAHVSHEIRTPLNAIMGMNELALETPVTEAQRRYLTVVQASAEALLVVINDLLDLAKIEAGKLELDLAPFSVRAVLKDIMRSFALRAHRKGLELVGRVDPNVPSALVGDAGRLRQVLINLIGNAVKFTEQGEVVVTIAERRLARADMQGTAPALAISENPASAICHLQFEVTDTGIGIPQDQQRRVFEAFEQAENSTTRRYGGTGLGLSIASRLVAWMGGQISVDSAPGRGSTFCFMLPLSRPPLTPDRTMAQRPAELRGLPILVIDDNATSRHTLTAWLRGWRTEPTAVGDGAAALQALGQAAAAGSPFALIVLDSRRAGTDALSVATQIRQTPALACTAILLLTVEDQAEELKHYHNLGVAACVMKPVAEEELLDAICRIQSLPRPVSPTADRPLSESTRPAPSGISAPTEPLHVLVAEDNPYNQALMHDLLARRGHSLDIAGDGRSTLAALEQHRYDVLLLDIHMPEIDGFAVVAAQRQREQGTGRHLPIVALTARSAAGERDRCLQAGMDDYLAKPVRAAELFATIERVVREWNQESEARRQDTAVGNQMSEIRDEAASARGSGPLSLDSWLLDPAALLAACDGDDALLRRMCEHFTRTAPDRLAEMSTALRDRDPLRLREAAHKLGGMVASFSATAAGVAAVLGQLTREGNHEAALQSYDHLSAMVDSLISRLNTLSVDRLRTWRDESEARGK
jgi:PAS domain S-box-containing protein